MQLLCVPDGVRQPAQDTLAQVTVKPMDEQFEELEGWFEGLDDSAGWIEAILKGRVRLTKAHRITLPEPEFDLYSPAVGDGGGGGAAAPGSCLWVLRCFALSCTNCSA